MTSSAGSGMETSVQLPITGEPKGPYLVIECLPNRTTIGERALLKADDDSEAGPQALLVEGVEYRYELKGVSSSTIEFEKSEFFDRDSKDGHTGRIRTGLYTGLVTSEIRSDNTVLGDVTFEIESIRLNYREDYRHMLRGLAEGVSELIMQRFGPSEQTFELDPENDAHTLYQRFAFLKSRLLSQSFQSSLERVTRQPFRSWEQERHFREPGRGGKASKALVREFSKAGPRVDWAQSPEHAPSSIPRKVETNRSVESVDNPPNRFVRYCLEHWRRIVSTLRDRLDQEGSSAPVERGVSEANATLDRLDELLSRPVFREVARMQRFPASSETLQKRPGYRDILEAYVEFEVAANLTWSGGRDTFGAGQRDVATLYEYWVFLKFAESISDVCDQAFDFSELLEVDESQLNIRLEKGRTQVLEGTTTRNERKVSLQLWFNRSFGHSLSGPGSWSKQMRPDISLKIEVEHSQATRSPVWLHFDAKYRVDGLDNILNSSTAEDSSDKVLEAETSAKRADILKMHAYRDAIRKSAGAYVIYPGVRNQGSQLEHFREFHELLPGLGAFPFRPTAQGPVDGGGQLIEFFDEIMEHLTSSTTDHERGRFWVDESFSPVERHQAPTPAQDLSRRPAADTTVVVVQRSSREEYREILENEELAIPLNSSGEVDRRFIMADYVVIAGPERPDIYFGRIASPISLDARNGNGSIGLNFDLLDSSPWPRLQKMNADDVFFLKSRLAPEDPVKSPLILSVQELLAGTN